MRYAIAFLLVIFIFIIGIVTLVNRTSDEETTPTSQAISLDEFADKDSTEVVWTVQGKLVGNEERRAIRVSVSKTQRVIEELHGYGETVEKRKTYANTDTAFSTFMQALERINFARAREVKNPDERGACPLGNRFIYELFDGGQHVFRTWSDTCSDANGTYAGIESTARTIFRNQIPDYSNFVRGIRL